MGHVVDKYMLHIYYTNKYMLHIYNINKCIYYVTWSCYKQIYVTYCYVINKEVLHIG